jgi:hypothetical protein
VLHGFSYANYLAELGADAQKVDLRKSLVDLALRGRLPQDAALPDDHPGLSEDEAISLLTRGGRLRRHPRWWTGTGGPRVLKKSVFSGDVA